MHLAIYSAMLKEQQSHYLMTRHARELPAKLKPFETLSLDVWICYFVIYGCLVITSFSALNAFKHYIKGFRSYQHHWSLSLIISIVSPEFGRYKSFLKVAILCQFLSVIAFSSFNLFYSLDLRTILVSQNFEEVVQGWDQMDFLRTKFIYLRGDVNERKSVAKKRALILNSRHLIGETLHLIAFVSTNG